MGKEEGVAPRLRRYSNTGSGSTAFPSLSVGMMVRSRIDFSKSFHVVEVALLGGDISSESADTSKMIWRMWAGGCANILGAGTRIVVVPDP